MPLSKLRETPGSSIRIAAAISAVLWAALIFGLSSIPSSGFPSHPEFVNVAAHFCEYLVFAVFITLALNNSKRALWKTALFAVLIASLYAVSDELHQYLANVFFDSGRIGDPFDWLTDTLGALVGAFGTVWFIRFRRTRGSELKGA